MPVLIHDIDRFHVIDRDQNDEVATNVDDDEVFSQSSLPNAGERFPLLFDTIQHDFGCLPCIMRVLPHYTVPALEWLEFLVTCWRDYPLEPAFVAVVPGLEGEGGDLYRSMFMATPIQLYRQLELFYWRGLGCQGNGIQNYLSEWILPFGNNFISRCSCSTSTKHRGASEVNQHS